MLLFKAFFIGTYLSVFFPRPPKQIQGYNSTSEQADDQKADMEQHFSDAYFEVLNEFNQGADADEFQIGFAGGNFPLLQVFLSMFLLIGKYL